MKDWKEEINLRNLKLSIIITAKDKKDKKLKQLLESIKIQTYPKELYEILVITKGTSESAKAIGIRQAKGRIVCIMASDNYLVDRDMIAKCMRAFQDDVVGAYPIRYAYLKTDNILNRYFSLMGCNDLVPYFLQKNDRVSYLSDTSYFKGKNYIAATLKKVPTLGDNGFFVRKGILMDNTDMDNYSHIDVCQDLYDKGFRTYALVNSMIWHKTGGNFFKFFVKRFKYALKLSKNRRWHMVTKKDIKPLIKFILSTFLIIPPLIFSIKAYKQIKDRAWFIHYPVCLATIITYGVLAICKKFRL